VGVSVPKLIATSRLSSNHQGKKMIWNTAAGIIIGGGVLLLFWLGVGIAGGAYFYKDRKGEKVGLLINLVAIGIGAWIVFFKAHFQ
jgi:hypothetical protein